MNSQIYIVETCSPMTQITTQQGVMNVQTVKLREVGGLYAERWIVENTSSFDLTNYVGKPIACSIQNMVNQTKEGREFNSLRIREVVLLAPNP